MKTPPLWKPFQPRGIEWLCEHPHGGLLDDPGLGKTVQSVCALEKQRVKGPKLILCSKPLMGQWRQAIQTWAPRLGKQPVLVLDKPGARRQEAVREFLGSGAQGWLILNREVLSIKDTGTSQRYPLLPLLEDIYWGAIIVDEAQHFRDRKSGLTRGLISLHSPIQWTLTATPIDGRPQDLWPILYWFDPEDFPSYWRFVKKFCIFESNPFTRYKYVCPNPLETQNFRIIVDHWFLRRTKSEVMPYLPPLVEQVIEVELSPDERRWYNEMARRMLTWLDDNTYVAASVALAQLTRLKQLATCAAVFDGPYKSSKMDVVMDLMSDWPVGYKGVIASHFRQVIEHLYGRLQPQEYVSLVGGMSARDHETTLKAFREDPKVRLLLMTAQTGGEGVNLEAAQHLVVTDLPWSSIQRTQLIHRVHRGTSKHSSILVTYVLAKDTIDEVIWALLESKDTVNDQLIVNKIRQSLEEQ